ncbi:MAG TPA: AmmeMemoRadiSam system protein A [bacterium]|nr:AmmeMemoRadiSam system protein A [bacterium]
MTPDSERKGPVLLWLARTAIEESFGGAPVALPRDPWLQEPRATFVTLRKNEDLRGCVGSIEAHRPLVEDVMSAARAAAFRDNRFDPLDRSELVDVRLEVSVLSPLMDFPVRSEKEAIERLVPRRDGVIFSFGARRGLFLPKVWESLPDPQEFLEHLRAKAGLRPDFWSESVTLQTFTTEEFSEPDELPSLAEAN